MTSRGARPDDRPRWDGRLSLSSRVLRSNPKLAAEVAELHTVAGGHDHLRFPMETWKGMWMRLELAYVNRCIYIYTVYLMFMVLVGVEACSVICVDQILSPSC